MGHLIPFQPAPAEYRNWLSEPQPERRRLPSAHWLLLLLVAVCAVPRVLMALRLPGICPDGVLYIHLARAIEAGNLQAGFQEMALNIYPVILMALHRLGLDWELAAAAWGVTISSLVVLPLWGWVRRQFDDRVALVACLVYAVQPKMIEWCPEAMRDPTFWFLFMLAIYWLWRAVTEVRHGYFVAAGAAITLASLTRIEGLLLLIPLALWTFWRWSALATGRGKLLRGATLCVAVFPSLLVSVNLIWLCMRLSGQFEWAGVRLSPLARVQWWLESVFGSGAGGGEGTLDPSMTLARKIRVFIPTMTRGLSPIFALLMFGGLWGWRRVWARRDHQPLFYAVLILLCGIWVQLWYGKCICPRYALPIVLLASPFAALGMLALAARIERITQRLQWSNRRRVVVAACLATAIAAVGLVDALGSSKEYFQSRRTLADLGRWVGRQHANPSVLVGQVGIAPIVSFYAGCHAYETFNRDASDALILGIVTQSKADVVVLQPWKQLTSERCAVLIEQMKQSGLKPVSPNVPPSAECACYVLVHSPKPEEVPKTAQRR
jgi:hypothetical protein